MDEQLVVYSPSAAACIVQFTVHAALVHSSRAWFAVLFPFLSLVVRFVQQIPRQKIGGFSRNWIGAGRRGFVAAGLAGSRMTS